MIIVSAYSIVMHPLNSPTPSRPHPRSPQDLPSLALLQRALRFDSVEQARGGL
jgi:hypothetical protein